MLVYIIQSRIYSIYHPIGVGDGRQGGNYPLPNSDKNYFFRAEIV